MLMKEGSLFRTTINKAFDHYQRTSAGRNRWPDGDAFRRLMDQGNHGRGSSEFVRRCFNEATTFISSLAAVGAALKWISTVKPTLTPDGDGLVGQVDDPLVQELIVTDSRDGLIHLNREKHVPPLTSLALVASGLISFFSYMKLYSPVYVEEEVESTGSGWGSSTTSTMSVHEASLPPMGFGNEDGGSGV